MFMKRWFRLALFGAALCAAACRQDNPIFGPLPGIVCDAAESSFDKAGLPTPIAADRIYRKLLPRFGELRGRNVPFTVETEDYEVLEVKLKTLRRSCDIAASVTVRPAKDASANGSLRLYFLGVDKAGEAFTRGIVFAVPADNRGDWSGEATFHLLTEADRYMDFDRMMFVPRECFNAAAEGIRRR